MSFLTPIALFVFRRPAHTRLTLESLAKNPEFTESPLFIYCDGARHDSEMAQVEETRRLVRNWPHPNKTIFERDRNWGLANSLIEGVTQLCEKFGRVIVVEDDLVVSPMFLNYLNAALKHYADEPKVMQVSGYMFPIDGNNKRDAQLLPIISTWGWATWDRAWKYFGMSDNAIEKLLNDSKQKHAFNLEGSYPYIRRLKQQINGKSDSWGIRWYLSVFVAGGMVVYPPKSLVQNIGQDGSGTHCRLESTQESEVIIFSNELITFPDEISINHDGYNEVKKYLCGQYRVIFRAWVWLRTELTNCLRKLV
jgi:hypothetical protein